MKTQITLFQTIDGYLLDAHARHLSPKTILDYQNGFRHLTNYLDNPILSNITKDDIRHFLSSLGTQVITPDGIAQRPSRILSKKSILNIHIALSALWTWAINEGFVTDHIIHAIKPPRPEQPVIEPFTRDDVIALLAACEYSATYTRPGKRECRHSCTQAERNRAIILLLLDTGIRSSELVADPRRRSNGLLIKDLDQRNGKIRVTGKGDKGRIIPVCHRTIKAVWRYLLPRQDVIPNDPLFTNKNGGPLTVSGLLSLIKRLGKKTGIHAYPHRFRHTFAVNFLRNGGNTLELQRLLGHSTLEMVKRYVIIAQVDLDNAHRRASPVTNWNL